MAEPIDPETGKSHIRLFVQSPLAQGQGVRLSREQTHYLKNVMRQAVGDQIRLFNGQDGEWLCRISRLERNACHLEPQSQTRPQMALPDVWLLFAPLKKARIDYLAQKATELGAARLQPVITRRTQVARVNVERLQANAVEAAEQCGCLSVPEVANPLPLPQLISAWDEPRRILYCDEGPGAPSALAALKQAPPGPWAVLLGPEGGFDSDERALLRGCSFVVPVSLGPRIMRADTAAVAALTLWQAALGDWR